MRRAARSFLSRPLTIIAQDPTLGRGRSVLTAQIDVPAEKLAPGPRGARVSVIDIDASTDRLYEPSRTGLDGDPFLGVLDSEKLLTNPHFHAQNVYAIVMATLARFERALGRRVSWAFPGHGHQLKIAPHAFQAANAFYSRRDEALLFGYFPGHRSRQTVFTCLSHDIVTHETTHALLDGLRSRYNELSSPDQAAFHEGFADVVALLSVFRLREVIDLAFEHSVPGLKGLIPVSELSPGKLRASTLFGLAEQMGDEMDALRRSALRQSVALRPQDIDLGAAEFQEPHRRGEVFVAAMLGTFINVWTRRLRPLLSPGVRYLDRARVVEEGASAADHLLTMAIRAIDYAPPVDLLFSDYFSAIMTADTAMYPDGGRYDYRKALDQTLRAYGISPAPTGTKDGLWRPQDRAVSFDAVHFETMQRDPDEVFRFVWENRAALGLDPDAYTYVESVRPSLRLAEDGFALRETLVEYVQILDIRAGELRRWGVRRPDGMPDWQEVRLYGGGTLLFDEYGRLKYNIANSVRSPKQNRRLQYLWETGAFSPQVVLERRFSRLHRRRAAAESNVGAEVW